MVTSVKRLKPTLGAEVIGLDLSAFISEENTTLLRAAYSEHGVLVFREQHIDDAALVRFANHFGDLQIFHQAGREKDVLPEIFRTANTDINGKLVAADSETAKMLKINWLWHIDSCYREIPAKGVVMYASDISGDGGNTIFVNAATAYDDLSQSTKQRIECLTARHSFEFLINNHDLPPLSADEANRMPKADQPMVRQHSNGRRSLFLSPPYMEPIDGLSEQESTSLVNDLTEFATQERYRYCHEWRRHDVVIWDNSWTIHRVTPFDISGKKRVMRGATILGTEPVISVR